MPLFRLSSDLIFPPPDLSRSDGLLCFGGDLSPERLTLAYKNGIFPWFSEHDPILWWSPDPRLVLFPEKIHISRTLKKAIRQTHFKVRINTAFDQTIVACSKPRPGEENSTWLVEDMIDAYIQLHHLGIAHSVETWDHSTLVGGLYGISFGGCFFGESMFSKKKDASKLALVALSQYLSEHRFDLIDCQVTTRHLVSMGAMEITRKRFLDIIRPSVEKPVSPSLWQPGRSIPL